MAKRNAIVVSVNSDPATRQIHDSAIEASDILSQAGYEVFEFFGNSANAAGLYTTLYALSSPPAIGFFAAHGNDHYLVGNDDKPLFNKDTGAFFKGSILLINACLEKGKLPEYSVSTGAACCIGYSPRLFVIPNMRDEFLLKLTSSKAHLKQKFDYCLLAGLEAMIRGETAGAALIDTELAWRQLWELEQHDANNKINLVAAKLLQRIFSPNLKALKLWGPREARISETKQQ